MEEKIPKNLEDLIGQLERAVPPITPSSYANLSSTNNGVKADTDPDREMAAMVNAARRLAHGPKPDLPEAALNRIEAQLRARHAAVHHGVSHDSVSHHSTEQAAPASSHPAIQQPAPSGVGVPITRTTAVRANSLSKAPTRMQAPSRAQRIARASWQNTKRTLRYVAAVLLVIVLLTSGLTAASANSVPNEPLYTVKLGVEEIRLGLVSENGEPGLRVNFAGRRLDEFETLLARHIIYPKVLEEASAQMNRALTLMAAGYGNRQKLDAQIADLTYQQGQLIQDAAVMAQPDDYARLQVVSTWNSALYLRVVAESVDSLDPTLTSGQGAPAVLPDVQRIPGDTAASEQAGQVEENTTLNPANPGDDPAELSDTTDNGNSNAAQDKDKSNNKDKDKDKDNNGQGQGNTGNQGQGQGNTGNQGQGQGNTSDPANQGNSGNSQGNNGNNGNNGQVNPGNSGQGQGQRDADNQNKDKDKK